MINPQLEKVLELVKRTGDRCIVLDQSSDQALVVMGLDEYEALLSDQENAALEAAGEASWPAATELTPANPNESIVGQSDLSASADLASALSGLAPETSAVKEETLENEQFYFEPVEGAV